MILIWTHGRDELDKFLAHLNSCHDTIKFTIEASEDRVNFLDTTLHKTKEGKLWTDLYCKPTDSHMYLHYESAHPSHCKKSLPYSQLLRLKRICTKQEDFVKHCIIICCHFIRRGYPTSLITDAIIKASRVRRMDLLENERKHGLEIHLEEMMK